MRFSIAALSLLITVATYPAFGATFQVQRLDGSTISIPEIDQCIKHAISAGKVTGLGLTLFNRHKIVFSKTYGLRDTDKRLPLTKDSIMMSASLSKSAFAYMVMQLVDEKRLNLDKPVYEYLPKPLPEYDSYKDLAADPRYRQITARMLLSHTSGFPNWRRFTDDGKLSINFTPGSRFAYSGEGIDLLQLVVETIAHAPLNDLMRERIFDPFGMTHTSMIWESRFEPDYANGYDEQGHSLGPERRRHADAAGSMQTTLTDYSRFLEAVMQGRGLSRKAREEMLAAQIRISSRHEFPTFSTETTHSNEKIRLSYGLGWGLYWSPYGEAFFKEGHDDGWRHYFVIFDDRGAGILIMTNSSNGEGIYQELLETLLKNTYTPIEWEGFEPIKKP